MSSTPLPGIVMTLCGLFLGVFHRKLGHRYAVYYQTWPETRAKMHEWSLLLGGGVVVFMGIVLLGNTDYLLLSVFQIALGLVWIVLSDRQGRWLAWCQSEKYHGIVQLLGGLVVTAFGVLLLLTHR